MCTKAVYLSNILINNSKTSVKNTLYESKRSLTTKLIYNNYGNPSDVVNKVTENTPEPGKNEVLIEMLAAPINPVDINLIQGKYPIKKPLPAVAGYEGTGRIIKLGEKVETFQVGDHVIPVEYNLGTWRSHLLVHQNVLKKLPRDLPPAVASILMVNPLTVYRMLKDFVTLQLGDTVIQNGSNSSCGQLVIQLCKFWGFKTINIVRSRENIDELKHELKKLGANYVLTEEELRSTDLFKSGEIKKPNLGLNCIGGKSSSELLRKLDYSGTLVTYGGMSTQPVTIPVSALIFKNIKFVGFNVNRWNANCSKEERDRTLDELISMFLNGQLTSPAYTSIHLDNFKEALHVGFSNKKYIFEIKK